MVRGKLLVIGDESLAIGFKLAGVENVIQTTKEEFQRHLETALSNKEFGIIVVNELMFNDIEWRLKKKIDASPYPIIVAVPDINGAKIEGGEDIQVLVKRALGLDISAAK